MPHSLEIDLSEIGITLEVEMDSDYFDELEVEELGAMIGRVCAAYVQRRDYVNANPEAFGEVIN